MREKRLAECAGESSCVQKVIDETDAAIERERQLAACLDYAYGGSEKNICKFKYGGGFF